MKSVLLFCISVLVSLSNLYAQQSFGGKPRSFMHSKSAFTSIPVQNLPAVDMAEIQKEDNINISLGKALRIGVIQPTVCNFLASAARDTLTDGGIIWRMAFHSPDAVSMSLSFSRFSIPERAEFFVYNQQKDFVIGMFTKDNMLEDQTFYTQGVEGDTIILEYYEPKNVGKRGELIIDEIGHFYKGIFSKATSGSCEIDVMCSEGDNWRDQIKSVGYMEISASNGSIYQCSGSLINNVREDKKQYFLSANHCIEDLTVRKYVFYFNYQKYTCKGQTGDKTKSVTGATIRANNNFENSSDFLLLEITGQIPLSYDVYFSGWDRRTTAGSIGSCIHHPEGDWKKISIPRTIKSSAGGVYFIFKQAWEVNWYITNNKGVTEGGSSGSPLYGRDKLIIGQLWGGYSNCDTNWLADYYGKFSYSWNATSLTTKTIASFLDPDNTGAQYVNGTTLAIPSVERKAPRISIYPNPTTNYLYITDVLGNENSTCYVYNLMGNRVYEQKVSASNNMLNLQNLPSGFYILELVVNGNKHHANVLVKQ